MFSFRFHFVFGDWMKNESLFSKLMLLCMYIYIYMYDKFSFFFFFFFLNSFVPTSNADTSNATVNIFINFCMNQSILIVHSNILSLDSFSRFGRTEERNSVTYFSIVLWQSTKSYTPPILHKFFI